ncbi:hypothetical protein [Agreia sp.]
MTVEPRPAGDGPLLVFGVVLFADDVIVDDWLAKIGPASDQAR